MKGERVAQLELLLRSHPEGLRRAEIARRLGVHRSTISRYVEDLSQYINIYEENNLLYIGDEDVTIRIVYPCAKKGGLVSLVGILLGIGMIIYTSNQQKQQGPGYDSPQSNA